MASKSFEESVPIDVVEALFNIGSQSGFAVYDGIMEEFPEFRIPGEFTPIGSTYFGQAMRAALVTELAVESAAEVLLTSLTDQGWVYVEVAEPFRRDVGFVTDLKRAGTTFQLCHDDIGQLSLSVRQRQNDCLAVLTHAPARNRHQLSCKEFIAQQKQAAEHMRGHSGLSRHLPRLLVPEELQQESPAAWLLANNSASSYQAESEASVRSDWGLEKLYKAFAEQISAQGWTPDTQAIGKRIARGSWLRTLDNGLDLIANFSVVKSGEPNYQLKVEVESLGGGSGGSLGVRIERSG